MSREVSEARLRSSIRVDDEVRVGSGHCAWVSPAVFDQHPDTGVAFVLAGEDALADVEILEAEEAAMTCPVSAIDMMQ